MFRKGFTLIELLVVISIVALLSSVVMASLNSAREKGRIGAGKQFDANVYHAVADQAVGIWDFDECTGTTAVDRSGNGNTGTLTSGASFSPSTLSGIGCSVLLDGINDYVSMGVSNANFDFSGDFTVSHWAYANSLTSGAAGVCGVRHPMVQNRDWGWNFTAFSNGDVRFYHYYDSVNNETVLATGAIQVGKWYHIVGVKSGSKKSLYIDGVLKASGGNQSTIYYNGNDFPTIGFYHCGGQDYYWDGYIDGVRIYEKSLTAREVGEMYAAEAPSYRFAEGGRIK